MRDIGICRFANEGVGVTAPVRASITTVANHVSLLERSALKSRKGDIQKIDQAKQAQLVLRASGAS